MFEATKRTDNRIFYVKIGEKTLQKKAPKAKYVHDSMVHFSYHGERKKYIYYE